MLEWKPRFVTALLLAAAIAVAVGNNSWVIRLFNNSW
jgi:hypothetical protein